MGKTGCHIISVLIFLVVLPVFPGAVVADDDVTAGISDKETNPVLCPVSFFRRYVSSVDGDRCPMYPSCSTYAMEAFKKCGLLKGWIMTCDRLLRCGGDETKYVPLVRINGKALFCDPVSNNTD